MYVSLMYRLWKILLSNMSRPETFGMTLVDCCRTKIRLENIRADVGFLAQLMPAITDKPRLSKRRFLLSLRIAPIVGRVDYRVRQNKISTS